jgi:hypothetical protein
MITIPIRVAGDHWHNPQEVKQLLEQCSSKDTLVLDLCAEGACLSALGVVSMLEETGRDLEKIYVTNWPNTIESVPFQRTHISRLSHFFWMSESYMPDQVIDSNHKYKLGFFVGRKTIPRQVMMWELYQQRQPYCLFSLMRESLPPNDMHRLSQWVKDNDTQQFLSWWQSPPIDSVDMHTVRDQYVINPKTNRDLLNVYQEFDIELVAETYCQGDAFFPTEKTVRPLAAGKAMVVYGPKRFLRRLRDLGFQTWGHIWDESYDELEGVERWRAMRRTLETVFALDSMTVDVAIAHVVAHNRQVLENLITRYRPT